MEQKTIAAGLVSLVVGFALGNLTAGSGPDLEQIDALISKKMAPANDAMSGLSSGIEEQMTALGARLDGLEDKIEAAADTSGLDAIGTRIDAMAGDLKNTLSEQGSAAAERIAALGTQISTAAKSAAAAASETVSEAVSETKSESAPEAAPETAATAAAPNPDATPAMGASAGETVILVDGAVRAFVSRVDDAGARLLINRELVTLATGTTHRSGDCTVSLDAVDRGHALISATCGTAAAPSTADTPAPAVADPAAAETGSSAGETAILGDGAARVFVSGVSDDGTSARIAVNGVTLQTVAAGDTIAVGDGGCSVTVDAIGAGHVSFDYGC